MVLRTNQAKKETLGDLLIVVETVITASSIIALRRIGQQLPVEAGLQLRGVGVRWVTLVRAQWP